MQLLHHQPRPPLDQFVDVFWYYEAADALPRLERVLPTGSLDVIINLREDCLRVYDADDPTRFETAGGALLWGVHSRYIVIDQQPDERILGVHFRPGGALPFLAMPASEVTDRQVALDTLWGHSAASLRARLLEAGSPAAMFQVIESFLINRAKRTLEHHPAVQFALKAFDRIPHALTVAAVSDRIGMSQRRFIDRFRTTVGLTPKRYCRIRRFQQILDQVHGARRVDWANVAASCGYYDQSHFIHEFQEFSGINPSQYLADRGDWRNHVTLRV